MEGCSGRAGVGAGGSASGPPGYGLHIPHDLLNKRVIVQLFRVHHLAVHNAALGQGLPDGDGVHASSRLSCSTWV